MYRIVTTAFVLLIAVQATPARADISPTYGAAGQCLCDHTGGNGVRRDSSRLTPICLRSDESGL